MQTVSTVQFSMVPRQPAGTSRPMTKSAVLAPSPQIPNAPVEFGMNKKKLGLIAAPFVVALGLLGYQGYRSMAPQPQPVPLNADGTPKTPAEIEAEKRHKDYIKELMAQMQPFTDFYAYDDVFIEPPGVKITYENAGNDKYGYPRYETAQYGKGKFLLPAQKITLPSGEVLTETAWDIPRDDRPLTLEQVTLKKKTGNAWFCHRSHERIYGIDKSIHSGPDGIPMSCLCQFRIGLCKPGEERQF